MVKRFISIPLLACCLLLFPVGVSAQYRYQGQTANTRIGALRMLEECGQFSNRQYEVCTAYVVNASLGARLPYYKYGSSDDVARRNAAKNRLESRYSGAARTQIEDQVAGWPPRVDVEAPKILIESVNVSSDHNRAILNTREDWRVTTSSGLVLYREDYSAQHTVHMERVPGLILHKWIVTDIE